MVKKSLMSKGRAAQARWGAEAWLMTLPGAATTGSNTRSQEQVWDSIEMPAWETEECVEFSPLLG